MHLKLNVLELLILLTNYMLNVKLEQKTLFLFYKNH